MKVKADSNWFGDDHPLLLGHISGLLRNRVVHVVAARSFHKLAAVTRRVNGIKKAEPQRIALIVQLSSPAMSLGVSKNRAVTAPTMNPPMWAM